MYIMYTMWFHFFLTKKLALSQSLWFNRAMGIEGSVILEPGEEGYERKICMVGDHNWQKQAVEE